MNKSRKLYSILIVTLVLITIITSFSFSINGEDNAYTGTTFSVKSGISIVLPEDYSKYALWDQATEDYQGYKIFGFPDLNTMYKQMEKDHYEFQAYKDDAMPGDQSFYEVFIDYFDAPDELTNQNIFSSFCEHNTYILSNYESCPKLGYGTVTINNQNFFKIFYESDLDTFNKGYVYLFATNDGYIHEIYFCNRNRTDEPFYIDNLAYNVMSTISLSSELSSKILSLNGDSFHMIQGYHTAKFNFESGASSNTNTGATPVTKTPYQKFISFEFPTWIILIVLIFILIFKINISPIGEWQDNPLSLQKSRAIQGFSAVCIIIHHLAQELIDKAGVFSIFSEFGVLFVGIFFFFSGYGLYTSLKTKENYLSGFLKHRLPAVLIPMYVCILIFMLFSWLQGQTYTLTSFLETISGWILISSHMWYVIEISILYIAFFIIYKFVSNRKIATSLMAVFVLMLVVGSLLLGHGQDMSSKYWFMGEWWYNTTFIFIFGIIVSQNEEKFRNFARKFYKILLPLFTILTIAFYYLATYVLNTYSYWSEHPGYSGYGDKFICLSIQLPWVLFFVIAVLLIMMKVKFENPILKFLGSISLELYLIHNLFLLGLHDGSIMSIKSASLYIVLTILLSIALATIVNGLDKYIVNSIKNKSKFSNLNDEEDLISLNNNRIHSIDVMRIIMAFLVVTIHIPFKDKAGEIFITYGKIAVPFFLVVCGYLLYRQDNKEMMSRLKKQTVRIMLLYIIGNVIYGIATVLIYGNDISAYFTSKQILDFILYNMSPFSEHLWYLGSLFYALVILMILNKFKVMNYAMFISPILLVAYVVLSHLNIAEYYALRNVILVTLPYVMMGMLIRRYQDKLVKIKGLILWIIALILCVTAVVELNTYKMGVDVPFVSCELLVYVIFILCLKYPDFGKDTLAEKMGRELSLPIYIFHILTMMILRLIIPTNAGLLSNYGAITVFVVTAIISALFVKCKKLIIKK